MHYLSGRGVTGSARWILAVLALAAAPWARAVYDPHRLDDPTRRWAISLAVRGEYDDNIHGAESGKTNSFKTAVEPRLMVNLPLDQTFVGLRYSYLAEYWEARAGDEVDQVHALDVLFSHTFTPRLVLDLRDSVRRGIEPELVETRGGVPFTTRRVGDYLFHSATGRISYNFTRRWTGALEGQWAFWRYDDAATAASNDHDVWHLIASAMYGLDPRTVLGANYRYQMVDYAAPAATRNSQSHQPYISVTRRINPQLSAQLEAGIELREFDDGQQDMAPIALASLTYNYTPDSTISAGARYTVSETDTEVAGSFRSADTISLFAQLSHSVTKKLRATVDTLLAMNQFQNPVGPLIPVGDREDYFRVELNLVYRMTHWCYATFGYSYTDVASDFATRSYVRNRLSLGLSLRY